MEPDPLPCSLYYFPLFGRAEAVRMLLHHAGVYFLNKEISQEDWPQVKPTMPGGVMPCYEFPDGVRMTGTCSMIRFLGKKHGYYPADTKTAYMCDMLCDDYNDRFNAIMAPYVSPPETQKAVLFKALNEILPPWLDRLEKLCS